jgi:hypothetical protein
VIGQFQILYTDLLTDAPGVGVAEDEPGNDSMHVEFYRLIEPYVVKRMEVNE